MGDSTGRVGPDHSWSASTLRTLAEESAHCVSGRIEAVAANSGRISSGSLATEREAPFKRASRSLDRGAQKRVGGLEAAVVALAAVGTVDGPEVQVLKQSLQKARRAAQERPITALLSQTEAFVERARKRHANNSCKSWKRAKVDSLGCRKLLGHRKQQFDLHKRFV